MSRFTDAVDAVDAEQVEQADGQGGSVMSDGVTSDGTAAAQPPDREPPAVEDRWANRLAFACFLAAVVPVVVAAVRAVADDWMAVGDNALFAIRARDVLTGHHPLLGLWTSASIDAGTDMNHPGPLYFDLLAVPVRLGGDAGLAVGVGLLNIAAIAGMALVARRLAGPRGVVAIMLAAAGLVWAMGSELLFDPWQPHSMMLPFLCFVVLAWGLVNGDTVLLPWAASVASLVLQTHIGYAVVIPALTAWGVGALAVRAWRTRSRDPDTWPALRRSLRRDATIAVVVTLACWAQPLYEQLFGAGEGNLSRLASSQGSGQTRVGVRDAPRFVADIVALAPWWGRPSISEAVGVRSALPTLAMSIAALAVVGVLLCGATVLARWRSDAPASTAAVMGLALTGFALLAVSTIPVADYGVAAHHFRWLWPLAVFLTFAVVLALLGAGSGRGRAVGVSLVAVTAATIALGVLALPAHNARVGPSADADSMVPIRDLLPQLAPLRDEQGVLFDLTGQRFAEPYSMALMAELQRLGVPWYVTNTGFVRQLGDDREWPGEASVRLSLREGPAAHEVPAGAERIAFADGLGEDEDAELAALEDQLDPFITAGGLRLTAEAADQVPALVTDAQLRDPEGLFATDAAFDFQRRLVHLVDGNLLDVPDRWARPLERYAELAQRADRLTVAVVVEPL